MQLVDRALSALEVLSRNMDGLSVTELAEQLDIPASSTHRILTSLKGNHLVVQDAQTKKYRLGYKICGIAAGVVKGSALTQAAQTSMQKLAEKIDRNVVLCIMEHGVAMNIACRFAPASAYRLLRFQYVHDEDRSCDPVLFYLCRPCVYGVYGQETGA